MVLCRVPALVTATAHTMIYRPIPITELKAQTIEAIIRSEIMEARRQNRDSRRADSVPVCTFLPTIGAGLEAGQGRRQAVRQRLQELQRERQTLVGKETLFSHERPDRPNSPNEIDVMEP